MNSFLDEKKCDYKMILWKKGGYNCNGTCISVMPYLYLGQAWKGCEELEGCTRILRWENGSTYHYYLRKADDIFDNNTRFLHVDFHPTCRGENKI